MMAFEDMAGLIQTDNAEVRELLALPRVIQALAFRAQPSSGPSLS